MTRQAAVADLRWSGLDVPLPVSGAVSFRLIDAAQVPGVWSAWLQPSAADVADHALAVDEFGAFVDGDDVVLSLPDVEGLPASSRVVVAVDGQPVASGGARRSWRHRSGPSDVSIRVGDTVVPVEVGNVTIIGGGGNGGGGGVSDHRELTHRDEPGQHPIGAVEGLAEALDGKADSGAIPDVSGLVGTDDSRLSDPRVPLAHEHSVADIVGLPASLTAQAAGLIVPIDRPVTSGGAWGGTPLVGQRSIHRAGISPARGVMGVGLLAACTITELGVNVVESPGPGGLLQILCHRTDRAGFPTTIEWATPPLAVETTGDLAITGLALDVPEPGRWCFTAWVPAESTGQVRLVGASSSFFPFAAPSVEYHGFHVRPADADAPADLSEWAPSPGSGIGVLQALDRGPLILARGTPL